MLAEDVRLTSTRSCASAFSRIAQSIVTLLRTALTNSRAIVRNVSSPNTLTAASLVSGATKNASSPPLSPSATLGRLFLDVQ